MAGISLRSVMSSHPALFTLHELVQHLHRQKLAEALHGGNTILGAVPIGFNDSAEEGWQIGRHKCIVSFSKEVSVARAVWGILLQLQVRLFKDC